MDQKSAPLVKELAAIERRPFIGSGAPGDNQGPAIPTGVKAMDDKGTPALGWHHHRAAQEWDLADRSDGPDARDRHRRLANMHERAANHGYELQMVEDR